jgi:hypothetical protein
MSLAKAGLFCVLNTNHLDKAVMHPSQVKPWYKQFWPWFLIVIPLLSMTLSFNMLRLALDSEDSLVMDDHYKQGKAINLNLRKIDRAKALNLKSELLITSNEVKLLFVDSAPSSGAALTLAFYHATQDYKDISVTLLKDASGAYRAMLQQPLMGKWRVTLFPYDQDWKIQKTFSLPQQQPIQFNP